MARKPLSATEVDNARLPDGVKEKYFLAGDKLYLRLRQGATGLARDWLFRYAFLGNPRKFGLGSYPEISLADARLRAADAAKLLAQGIDPKLQAERQLDEAKTRAILEKQGAIPTTVAELFTRWHTDYLTRKHGDGGDYISGTMERHVLPVIGTIPLADLRARHVVELLDYIRGQKDLTRTCGVVLDAIRQMCKYAVPAEWIQGDPTVGLKKERWDGDAVEIERWLSVAEIKQLAQAMALSDMPARWQHAIWLILACGTRAEETVLAEVRHFTLESDAPGGYWLIPKENQKQTNRKKALRDFEILLSPLARQQVEALITLSPSPAKGPHYLFPGRGNGSHANEKTLTHLVEDRQRTVPLKGRKCSAELVLPGGSWSPHDLRRTMGSLMEELGTPAKICHLCLNHVTQDKITRTYLRSPLGTDMATAWLAWGKRLAEIKAEAEDEPEFKRKLAEKLEADRARNERYAVVKARRQRATAAVEYDDI